MGLRLSKIAGTLTELSGEELARQQGMEAAPTSPLGSAGIGASQDVAKMAGTGEQIRASLRETLKERTETKDVMAEAERGTERARFDVSRIQQQLNTMTGLGSLDNRIASQIRTNLLKVAEGGIKNPIDTEAVRAALSKGGTVAPAATDINTLVEDLATLQSAATPEKVIGILKKLGISATIEETSQSLAEKLVQTGVFKQAGVADIKQLMDKSIEAQANLRVSQLGEDVGFDKQEVASALKVTTSELDDWTLEEVKAGLAAYSSQTFSNVDELRDVLASPAASQSQKDFARKRLAELGAIGVTSLEEKTNNLERQMEEGDTVKFGNTQVRVADLLTKPEYKAVLANALATPEGLAELEKTDPQLADWVKKNQARLTNVRSELAKGTADFIAIQNQYNTLLKDTPTDLLDKLAPGWRDAKSNKDTAGWLASLPPVLGNLISEANPERKTVKASVIGTILSKTSKEYASKLTAENLEAITDAAGNDAAKASSLTEAWIDSDTARTAAFDYEKPVIGTGVDDFTEQESVDLQKTLIEQLGKNYTDTTIDGFVKTMQTLASGTPQERMRAVEMYRDLPTLRALVKKDFSPQAIEKIKEQKVATRVSREVNEAIKPVQGSIDTILNAIKGRAGNNWLRNRGMEVISPLGPKLAGIQADLATILSMNLTPAKKTEEIKKIDERITAVKAEVAGQLAAFLDDKGTRPGDALDAAELILATGLQASLPPQTISMIRERIESNKHVELFDKNNLSSGEKLQRIYAGFGGTRNLGEEAVQERLYGKKAGQADYEG
jgi:hypothetical protein